MVKDILISLFIMNLTWIYFLAIIHLREAYEAGRLNGFPKYLGYVNLVIGGVLDIVVNWVFATVILLELPQELLTTTRLNRHIKTKSGWRYGVSLWFCKHMLSTFDPHHCGE